MKRYLFIVFVCFTSSSFSQFLKDRIINISTNINYVPLLRNLNSRPIYVDYDISLAPQNTVQIKSKLTKQLYNLTIGISSINKKIDFNIGFNYATIQLYNAYYETNETNYTSAWGTTPNYNKLRLLNSVTDQYFGISLKINSYLKNPAKGFFYGLTLGSGQVKTNTNFEIEIGKIDYKYKSDPTYKIDDYSKIKLPYQGKVTDLYLKGHFGYQFTITSRLSLGVNLNLPFLRIFMYNNKVTPGMFLFHIEDNSIFNGLGYINKNDSETLNRHLAFSLKKTHAISFNIGLKYSFKTK